MLKLKSESVNRNRNIFCQAGLCGCAGWAYLLLFVRPQRGYKTFFMLNSSEHEIYPAHKCLNANQCWHFYIY